MRQQVVGRAQPRLARHLGRQAVAQLLAQRAVQPGDVGLVMITHFNQLHARGQPLATLVVNGARRRLRPVLMTASITAFGLVPLLPASGPGSEIQRPLAIVVIGGLVSATALTLLLPGLSRRFGSRH